MSLCATKPINVALRLDQPQDDVGPCLARTAQGGKLVGHAGLDPDQPLALLVEGDLGADDVDFSFRCRRLMGAKGDTWRWLRVRSRDLIAARLALLIEERGLEGCH